MSTLRRSLVTYRGPARQLREAHVEAMEARRLEVSDRLRKALSPYFPSEKAKQ